MNKKLQLILHEVKRQYRSERSFYQTVGITQRAWEKIKSGETEFSHMKVSTLDCIMALLFSDYEKMLVDESVRATNYNWYDNVIDAFHNIKLAHAKKMLSNGAKIMLATNNTENGQPRKVSVTKINIIEDVAANLSNIISFEVNGLTHSIPSGHLNRNKWWNENYENILVK